MCEELLPGLGVGKLWHTLFGVVGGGVFNRKEFLRCNVGVAGVESQPVILFRNDAWRPRDKSDCWIHIFFFL